MSWAVGFYHLCIYSCSGKCFSITSVAYRTLGAPVEGKEPKVEDEKSETDKGNGVTWDPSRLFPSVSPGQSQSAKKNQKVEPGPKDDTAR